MHGQVDLFGDSLTEEDLGMVGIERKVNPWNKETILRGEKETLGFYLSGHPLEQYARELAILATPIRDLRPEKNRRISIAGLIVNTRTLLTRKGDRMAFLTLEDQTGRQEVAVFSDAYHAKRDLLVKDNLVVIEGEVSPDEFSGGLKMRCIDLFDWETACAKAAKYLKIEVHEHAFNDEFTEKLACTLKTLQGKSDTCPVRVFYERAGARSVLKLGDDWRVRPNKALLEKLQELEGCASVEVQY